MAEVTKNEKVVKMVATVVEEESFTLKLTPQEAAAVFAVLGQVSGSPTGTPRGLTSTVFYAMEKAGVLSPEKAYGVWNAFLDSTGGSYIQFRSGLKGYNQ